MVPFTNILLSSLLVHFLASAPTTYAFNKPQVRVTTTFADFHARIMDQWGDGGGKFVKISSNSHHPFQGRTFGGAKRKEIRGTRAFGSGYPYGANDTTTVSGRPFPFGTWPLWWDQNLMGSDEYGPRLDAIRPGGMLVTVPLRTTTGYFNVTNDEVYHVVGDKESVSLLMISYVTWCHITPAWPSRFDPTRPNSTVRLENVVRYYRASSFAISSPNYNNTFSRSSLSDSTESTPLPPLIEYSPFLKCIDDVTFNALAILNRPPGPTPLGKFVQALAYGHIYFIGAALGVLYVVGLLLAGTLICSRNLLWSCLECLGEVPMAIHRRREAKKAQRKARKEAAARAKEAAARAREVSLAYERYP
ncbi:hypothetical protein FRC17_002449 [Serendipita sp. 399]|nr:hypothetical protein FRC17_002449 [Serendipita sp. 399]